jgi:type I restriction enzyme S subunit
LPDVTDPTVAICSTEFMPFVPVHEQWRPFLYELLKSPTIQEEICSRATGSTGSRQRVKPKDIAIISVVLPPPEIITAFCTIIGGLHKKLLANQRNSFSLAQIRDTLLPKLLSGEIELDAAEEVV